MRSKAFPSLPLPVKRALNKLGGDIADARRRRRIPTTLMAKRPMISRATLARIRQNIALALITKALVLALALFGLANLWMAIAADVGTTLVVVANALRLLRAPKD